jgi:hypothetical protein
MAGRSGGATLAPLPDVHSTSSLLIVGFLAAGTARASGASHADWEEARMALFGPAQAAPPARRALDGATGAGPIAEEPGDGCALRTSSADGSTIDSCLSCHAASAHGAGNHPVDVDYEGAVAGRGRGSELRPSADVVARGVFLPGGRIHCLTCHDPRSPWANHVALPPGSTPRPAADPRRPETYERRESSWRVASSAPARPLAPGAAVTPAPLCAACHALD